MFTKQKSDENKVLLAAAKDFLGGWTRDQLYDHDALLNGVKQFAKNQREQFPDVDIDRIRGRFFRAAAILRGRYYRNEGQQNREAAR